MNHKKELLRGIWVNPKPYVYILRSRFRAQGFRVPGVGFSLQNPK